MFCPQCGAQAEASVKFCRACGLNLSEYARLFTNPVPEPNRESREQAEQEFRQVKSVRALAAVFFSSLLSLLLTGLLFMVISSGAMHGWDAERLAMLLFALQLFLPMLLSGWGMYNLWRGKFFKTRRERLLNAYALLLEQSKKTGRLAPKPEMPSAVAETSSFHSPAAPISIAEPTTRELQPMTSDSGKIA